MFTIFVHVFKLRRFCSHGVTPHSVYGWGRYSTCQPAGAHRRTSELLRALWVLIGALYFIHGILGCVISALCAPPSVAVESEARDCRRGSLWAEGLVITEFCLPTAIFGAQPPASGIQADRPHRVPHGYTGNRLHDTGEGVDLMGGARPIENVALAGWISHGF